MSENINNIGKEALFDQLYHVFACTSKEELTEFAKAYKFDLKHDETLPTFFTGNVFRKNSIVVMSLNPRYNGDLTKEEQKVMDGIFNEEKFRNWLDICVDGFYPHEGRSDKMHQVFYNCYKVFKKNNLPLGRTRHEAFEFMHNNMVNVDWCPYYSETTPTFCPNNIGRELKEKWDDSLKTIINMIDPPFVFIHGASFRDWVNQRTDVNLLKPVISELSPNKSVHLYRGSTILGIDVPVIYLSWFINRANANENFRRIREYLHQEKLYSFEH